MASPAPPTPNPCKNDPIPDDPDPAVTADVEGDDDDEPPVK